MSSGLEFGAKVTPVEPPPLAAREATLAPNLSHRFPFRLLGPAVMAGDFFIIVLASLLSDLGYRWFFLGSISGFEGFFAVGILVFANFSALTTAQRNYQATSLIKLGRQVRYVTITWCFICFVLLGVGFTLKISGNFSRGTALSFFAIGWLSLIIFRVWLSQNLAHTLATRGFSEIKIILITESGQENSSRPLVDLKQSGFVPVKTYEITPSEIAATGGTKSLQEKLDDIISTSQQQPIDSVVLLIKWSQRRFIDNLVRMLQVLPIPVYLLPDDSVSKLLTRRVAHVGTAWTVELQRAPLTNTEQLYRRAFDLIGATLAIVLLAPVLLITALLIKLDSRGPVLFTQKRNGFNGSTFVIYKFRTMHVLEDGDIVRQATKNDPRVTRIGRWLRRTSIDELPQLLNVIKGDMSLVGPRPHAVAHNDEHQKLVEYYAFRHHMKPGITGWAQIHGYRGEIKSLDLMQHRVEHDIWYINNWTVWLDLRILLKTLVVIAYWQPMAY